jgi:hypothetical protein
MAKKSNADATTRKSTCNEDDVCMMTGRVTRSSSKSSFVTNSFITPVSSASLLPSNVIPVKQCNGFECEDMLIVDELLREVAKRRLFVTDDEPMEM